MRPKRKHTKSGDKLSPQEEKTKSVVFKKDHTAMSGTKSKTDAITKVSTEVTGAKAKTGVEMMESEVTDCQKVNWVEISAKIDDI